MDTPALKVIDDKISLVRRQIEKSQTIIEKEQQQVNFLMAKAETLEDLRSELTGMASPAIPGVESSIGSNGSRFPKPTEAIVGLLKERPRLSAMEIIDALENRVNSTAKNVRHNIRTTIFNLTKKGVLDRDIEDYYELASSAE